MDSEETTSTGLITSSFNTYLVSELQAHEQVSRKNLKATDEKIAMYTNFLEEYACKDLLSECVISSGEQAAEWKQLQKEQVKTTLHETSLKEKHLQKEVSRLKCKLKELEKAKADCERANKGVLLKNTEYIATLEKVLRNYSRVFSMNLSVLESGQDKIVCKVYFKETPKCLAFFEINRSNKEITSFYTKGVSQSDEDTLKYRFKEQQNASQLLVDFRNIVLKNVKNI